RNPDPLDFRGIQVACLTGENGAGKSSLLDAVTWALWGKARTRRDDDLIHQKEEEMQVQFDFSLAKNLYRVIRKRTSRGRGRSMLDLQMQDGDSFRSLAEPAIRGTQEKINRLLRLDYRTFINSAFLLQGRADEFTVQTPGERKAILADILGLDVWDTYEERAKEHIREIDHRKATAAAQIAEIDRELARQEEFKDTLTAAEAKALQLTDKLRAAESVVREIEAARQARQLKQSQQANLGVRLAQGDRQLKRIKSSLAKQHQLMAEYKAVLAAREEITAGYATWTEARAEEDALNRKLSRHGPLIQRQAKLEGAIQTARADLLARQRSLASRCAELEQAVITEKLATELETVEAQLAALREKEAARDAAREQLASLAQEAAGLCARNDALRTEMEATKEKIAMLSVETGADCPLCLQPLTEEHRQELLAQFQAEGTGRGDKWRANSQRMVEIKGERESVKANLQQLERALKAATGLQRRGAALAQKIDAAAEASRTLEAQRAELDSVTHQLENQEYASEARADLAGVRVEITALDYDPAAHEEIRALLRKYAPFEARQASLDTAVGRVEEAETTIRDLQNQEAEWRASMAADQKEHASLATEIAVLGSELVDAKAKERELALLRESKVMADNEVGAARQRLAALESQRERQSRILTQQSELAVEAAIYNELRAAFGKRGVPAMIIEAIIPEIEESANRLLRRMTDGRMQLRFETQRQKVTGGVAETLDIRISDELGTRNYELYSGGESFRVNFAIRIALSKL
ncbi:MAG: SMC family ATPase, partial [Planctomycetes bacterium]|nr:SMC family ATPase [Planctomycetota bacterium]